MMLVPTYSRGQIIFQPTVLTALHISVPYTHCFKKKKVAHKGLAIFVSRWVKTELPSWFCEHLHPVVHTDSKSVNPQITLPLGRLI